MRACWTGLAAFLLSFPVYLKTLCPSVYVEGSGELIGATCLLGTPHPTGYPLFCLAGRLFAALLQLDNPAYEVNLFSAFTGALATGALSLLLHWRGCNPWIALGTGLGFGFSRTFWSQVVIAEVYGLSMLAVIATAAAGLRAVEQDQERHWLLLAFLMGLGLTTHLNQVLVWPGLLILAGWRHPARIRRKYLLGKLIAFFISGYSAVLYLFLRNGQGPGFHWGILDTPAQWWDLLSGAMYRSSFFSMPVEAMALNAQRWGRQVIGEFHPLLVPVLAWGILAAYGRDRAGWLVMGMAGLVNLLVALNYHRDPNGLGVFFLLSILSLAFFAGWGLDDLCRRLPVVLQRERVYILIGLIIPIVVASSNYHQADHSQNRIPYTYGVDILRGLPPDAVLVAEGDDAAFILDYLQRLEGMRPDVALYNHMGRGRDLLAPDELRLEPRLQARVRGEREAHLIQQGDHPVFYLFARRLPVEGYRLIPAGLCYRVWPEGVLVPPELLQQEIDLQNARPTVWHRDAWVRKIQSNYWFMRGEQLQALGDSAGALAAYREAAAMARDSRTTQFNVALVMLRNNRPEEAWQHAQAARELDPWYPETYRLLAQVRGRQGYLQEAEELLKKAVGGP